MQTFRDDLEERKDDRILEEQGYSIVKRFDLDTDEDFEVAVKSGSEYVPDTRNIVEAFSEEMQNFIIEWSASFNKDKKG